MTTEAASRHAYTSALKSALSGNERAVISILVVPMMIFIITILADPSGALVDHEPISIDGASELTKTNGVVSGSGSLWDPYVIEGYSINGSKEHGVFIRRTNLYIVIRDITIEGDNGSLNEGAFQGISLQTVSNVLVENVTIITYNVGCRISGWKDITIRNVTTDRCWTGFDIRNTENLRLEGSRAYRGITGLRCGGTHNIIEGCKFLDYSHVGITYDGSREYSYNRVINCTITGNGTGVYIEESHKWTFESCIMDNPKYDIDLYDAHWIDVLRCTLGKSGMRSSSIAKAFLNYNIDSNTVDGKPLLFLKNATGAIVNHPVGQAFLVNCTNVTVTDQSFDGCLSPVNVLISNYCTVTNCTIVDPWSGISVGGWYCVGNVIRGNRISMGRTDYPRLWGVSFWGREITIEGNEITGEAGYGLSIWPDDLKGRETKVTVSDNRIEGSFAAGIRMWPDFLGTGIYLAGNCTILDCAIAGCEDGIRSNYWGVLVKGCIIEECTGVGLFIEAAPLTRVENTTLVNNTEGMHLFACEGAIITSCEIRRCGNVLGALHIRPDTIEYNSTSRGTPSLISNVSIFESPLGIDLQGGFFCVMDGNAIYDAEMTGIHLGGMFEIRMANCTMVRCGTGLLVNHSTDLRVSNNCIERCTTGIRSVSSLRITVDHNFIRNSTGYAIQLLSSGQGRLFHNTFEHNNHDEGSSSYRGPQAKDDGESNKWDNGREGNWWSDFIIRYPDAKPIGRIWDTPYELDAKAPNVVVDRYPLTTIVDPEDPKAFAGDDIIVKADQEFILDGSGSTDNYGITSFTWKIVLGEDSWTRTGQIVRLALEEPGTYWATLNVTDAWGNWDTDTIRVTVVEVIPTVADAGPDQTVRMDDHVTLDGSGSTADGEIVNFTWSFLEKDGGTTHLFGEIVSFVIRHAGIFEVTLTITDHAGTTATDHMRLTVLDVRPPIPVVDQYYTVRQFETFLFDGTRSVDDVGIESHTWQFVHDGDQVTLSGETTEFSFEVVGVYTVTLTVIDASGNSASLDFIVNVTDGEPPVISPMEDGTVYLGETVTLRHEGVTDNVGVASFEWHIEFGGEEVVLEGEEVDTSFGELGIHRICLTVVDEAGNMASHSFNMTVQPLDVPIADAGPDQVIDEGNTATMDGGASRDRTGISEYDWTFVYDGMARSLSGQEVSFTFDVPGTYEILLTVSNTLGKSASDVLLILVRDITQPKAIAGPDRTVKPRTSLVLNGSASYDNVGIVNYTWEIEYMGSIETHFGMLARHDFKDEGVYRVKLIASDEAGNTDSDEMMVTVREDMHLASINPLFLWALALIVVFGLAIYVLRSKRIIWD